ncbi:MAG: hypothetical protein LC753_08360, partial [Acidobacteria bacterium]|nr:hypothetical protein [Acidobacteriota bacterium]
DSELAGARADRDVRTREFREAEHDIAAARARLQSLEELDAARAEYGDGARLILAECENQPIGRLGSVADYLEVERGYERGVEACLGDLLQHVVVETHDEAAAGLQLARELNAGRVGFLVARRAVDEPAEQADAPSAVMSAEADAVEGLTALSQVVRVAGPAAGAIRAAISNAWIGERFDAVRAASAITAAPVATLEGDVFHGAQRVEGGARAEARGILTTKREIQEIRDRLTVDQHAADRLREEIAALDLLVVSAESAIVTFQGELHRKEKAIVGFEAQAAAAAEAAARVARKQDQVAVERRSAEEELRAQEARHDEAHQSIVRIEGEQQAADALLTQAQRRLFEARDAMQAQALRTSEAKATYAALVERGGALLNDVQRLEEAAAELESRVASRRDELSRAETRRTQLQAAIVSSEARLDADLRRFDDRRARVRVADDEAQSLRARFDEHEAAIREARRALDTVRAEAAQLDVTRATAETDLSHLAASCVEVVQTTLDEVATEVEQLELEGRLASPLPVDDAPEAAETGEDQEPVVSGFSRTGAEADQALGAAGTPPSSAPLTPDGMVADLRAKIERMGAVNMMAIDQFDDLESRHTFLTAQRKDLVDSITATGEAIKKIDRTTRERFREAFAAINLNFEGTFTTLFGGGRAGLVLLDESHQLESGIDIIAQPPGKRLQSVQLLSGGEKALTAMALMFAIFEYRPSPFCLLDEIDAPLDDANIGRFVQMLQGMQEHTQFILITHNRKTMEIADRLYGITMEEPGVSKLISVQLN